AILLPVFIEFSRCIGTYSSAKFELINIKHTGGGCAYENYVENGSINIASADFCHHMELLYSAIIEIFIEKYYINVK
ncbi:hypothetical protein, partial [Parablautia muri]